LCLARADITTKRPEKKTKGLGQIAELSARIAALAAEDAVVPPLPKGVGDALAKAFALPPSPRIGQLKKALEAAVDAGEIAPRLTSEEYVAFVTEHRERFGV
jgi:poly(A) polymerase